MGSTNGTYVGGKRIAGEQQLVGAPDVRLGGVKFIFRAVDAGDPTQGGQTRAIATLRGSEPKGRTTAKQGHGAAGAPTPARSGAVETKTKTRPEGNTAPSTGGTPVVVWIIAVLALLGVGLFLITSR